MVIEITAIVGAAAVALSLVFLGRQTMQLAKQTRINNSVGNALVMKEASDLLHRFLGILVQYPELRPYFYEGRIPPRSGRKRNRIDALSEALGDALDFGIMAVDMRPEVTPYEGWHAYADHMIESSPALSALIHRYPAWWPKLYEYIAK
ncbi:hypothetical protein J5X84_26705 [Streptosporangiaceae bacterium NEAU-GS5]|nr:hypothetical protein [Streptosporangiaceae bacterium NEAU-GS5]